MIKNQVKLTLPSKFGETVWKYGNRGAYAFAGEEALSYNAVNSEILAVMAMLERNGIGRGDKVAILSTNMPNWGIAFFAVTFMGAVAVPILPDFSDNASRFSERRLSTQTSEAGSQLETTICLDDADRQRCGDGDLQPVRLRQAQRSDG